MFDISPIQIIIVLAIAPLIFGPKRLPELGRNLGAGIRDFKGGITGEELVRPSESTDEAAPASAAAPAAEAGPVMPEPEALGGKRVTLGR